MIKMKMIAAVMAAVIAVVGVAPVEARTPAKAPIVTVAPRTDAKVRWIQEALNEFGAGLKVDGKMGAETRAMLAEFKKATGMKVNDEIDAETIASIDHALGHPGPGKTATRAIRRCETLGHTASRLKRRLHRVGRSVMSCPMKTRTMMRTMPTFWLRSKVIEPI